MKQARGARRWTTFPYAARAADANAALHAVHATFAAMTRRNDVNDPATIAWLSAIERFNALWSAALPAGFWDEYEKLKARDASGLEAAIAFLEADPWFFRSGYIKADLIRLIKRFPLTAEEVARLRAVVLNIVDRRDAREFRDYCRLARRVDGPELRRELELRLHQGDEGVSRRAAWALRALGAVE